MSLWEGSWLTNSGQAGVYGTRQVLLVVAVAPSAWHFFRQEFDAMLATDVFMFTTAILATGWACYRIRCSVCRMPVYAMRLIGLPRVDRQWFEKLSECPYCFDDGTGGLGNPDRVDRVKEVQRAWMYLLKAFFIVVVSLDIFLLVLVWAALGRDPTLGQ